MAPVYLIYILRRDLRLSDNPVFHAIQSLKSTKCTHLLPVYIFSPLQIEVSGFLTPGVINSPYPEARSRVGNFWRCGPHRAKFLAEGLWDLKNQLNVLQSDLIMRVGKMEDVICDMLRSEELKGKVGAVWIARDWASEERTEEEKTRAAIEREGNIEWKVVHPEDTLIHDKDLPVTPKQVSDVFTSFRKSVEPLRSNVRPPLPAPTSLPPLPPSISPQPAPFIIPTSLPAIISALQSPLSDLGLPQPPNFPPEAVTAHPFIGGETHAHARVRNLLASGAMSAYKDTRNGLLGTDFSTKLSGFLAHGFITARQIDAYLVSFEDGTPPPAALHNVATSGTNGSAVASASGYAQGENKGTAAVRFELLWRDYMRLCMRKYGTALFSVHGFRGAQAPNHQQPWRSLSSSNAAFRRFQNGTTGTGLIDASMRELYLTGYTSNRARQNCASFLSKHLGIDWRVGAEWYESLLIDYDCASNWGNWQYVAGVGNDPRQDRDGGDGRVFNPVKQGWDYDPQGEYVRTWVEELRGIGDVGVVFQGWKSTELLARSKSGAGKGKSKRARAGDAEAGVASVNDERHEEEVEALQRLQSIEWVTSPLVRINYERRGGGGGAGRGNSGGRTGGHNRGNRSGRGANHGGRGRGRGA